MPQAPAGVEQPNMDHDQEDEHGVDKDVVIEQDRANERVSWRAREFRSAEDARVVQLLDRSAGIWPKYKKSYPVAKMLITVPEMIWLTLYLIDSTPCTTP